MKLKGRIIKIFDTQKVSEKFSKREFVLKFVEDGQSVEYPQECVFQLVNKNTSLLDNVAEGQAANVEFNMRGKLWKDDKWFNSLDAYKIEIIGAPVKKEHVKVPEITLEDLEAGDDDLPF